jgi:hypothetical protein
MRSKRERKQKGVQVASKKRKAGPTNETGLVLESADSVEATLPVTRCTVSNNIFNH